MSSTSHLRRTATWVGLAMVCTLVLSGCKFNGAGSFPLPGGIGGGGYKVNIEFTDVLDLVPQSAVKVNDVTVGSVSDIKLTGFTARVTVSLLKNVVLPENTTAALRQTSLLGEKFVSLDRPTDAQGRLRDGMTIPLARTTRNSDIEEVLGALSLVLNGGSLEQIQTINVELTKALKGRESQVKDFLKQLNGFVGGLDAQKTQIIAALDGLDRLSGKLAAQRQVLATALQDIPKGAAVLADERAQLTKLLAGLNRLGGVATHVIAASKQNTVADLQALQPILSQLGAAGKDLPNALELLTTYPFPRSIDKGIKGDYANLFITVDASTDNLALITKGGGLPGGLPTQAPGGNPLGALPQTLPGQTAPKATVPTPTVTVPGVTGLGAHPDVSSLFLGGLS